jgi:hypothetical protein
VHCTPQLISCCSATVVSPTRSSPAAGYEDAMTFHEAVLTSRIYYYAHTISTLTFGLSVLYSLPKVATHDAQASTLL